MLLLAGCLDPPDPPPVPSPTGSVAVYVEWRADDAPVTRPVALFVDTPGGPADRIAADPDVTTFLNDRFHPVFHAPDAERPAGTVTFLAPNGCQLTTPQRPGSPSELIRIANEVIVRPEARGGSAPRLSLRCPTP